MADITTRQVGALNSLEYKLYFGKHWGLDLIKCATKTHHVCVAPNREERCPRFSFP